MSWAAVIGGAAGIIGGGVSGGAFGGRSTGIGIAPGLSKYTGQDWSEQANMLAKQALEQYRKSMGGLAGRANQTGQAMLGAFNTGAAQMNALAQQRQGAARSATNEAVANYRGYGREAEGNARDAYNRALGDIADSEAYRNSRGYNSANAMLAAGQRGEAQYGFSRAMSDIGRERAQLVGGAIERGRSQELAASGETMDLQRALLGAQLGAQERAFTLPAGIEQGLAGTIYQSLLDPVFLYPQGNVRRNLLGGQGGPSVVNPNAGFGEGIIDVGALLTGMALDKRTQKAGKPIGSSGTWNGPQPQGY